METSLATQAIPSRSTLYSLEARREFDVLQSWILSDAAMNLTLREVEEEEMRRLREVGRHMLQAYVRARGCGDVGAKLEATSDNVVYIHKRRRPHTYQVNSVFGEIEVSRMAYVSEGQDSIHPLDEALELSHRSFSYAVQGFVVKGAVQGPFDEAIGNIKDYMGLSIHKRSAEQIVVDAARDFDDFYKQKPCPTPEETAPILVASIDGKGIPMKKDGKAAPEHRRKKGEKANKKRMATVAAVYTIHPRVRTPESVVESLFSHIKVVGDKDSRNRDRPEHKRVWASLEKGKDRTIEGVAEEVERRDPKRTKKRTAVIDGERALQKRAIAKISGIILILDLLHVLEKLWKVAYVFFAEGSPEAEQWVKEHALSILQGKVSQVIKGMRQSATKRGIRGEKLKTVKQVSSYYSKNRNYMRYHEYLEQGLPIASGVVEGACKNLVKDRMERSGMRWAPVMAEAMLKMRSAYLSGDLDEYWNFHIAQEQKSLYLPGRWRPLPDVVKK